MLVIYENLFKRGNNNNIFIPVRKFVGVDKDSKRYLMHVAVDRDVTYVVWRVLFVFFEILLFSNYIIICNCFL